MAFQHQLLLNKSGNTPPTQLCNEIFQRRKTREALLTHLLSLPESPFSAISFLSYRNSKSFDECLSTKNTLVISGISTLIVIDQFRETVQLKLQCKMQSIKDRKLKKHCWRICRRCQSPHFLPCHSFPKKWKSSVKWLCPKTYLANLTCFYTKQQIQFEIIICLCHYGPFLFYFLLKRLFHDFW